MRVLTLVLLLLGSNASADVINLNNGDRITGEIKLIWDDKVSIKPVYSDEFRVDLEDVTSMETDGELDVEFYDGRQGYYKFIGVDFTGNTILEASGRQLVLALTDLKRVQEIEDYFEWESQVDLSHALSKGNTNSNATSLKGSIQFKVGDRRTLLGLRSIRENLEHETVKNSDRLNASYNWIFNDPWFLAINGTYEQDVVALLDRRVAVNPAIGYDIWDDPKRSWNVQVGAGYQSETITGQTSNSSLIDWRLRYSHDFFSDDLELYHNHQLTQTLEKNINNRKNLIFISTTGIRYDITDDIYLNVELKYDIETEPAAGVEGEDIIFLVGAGVEFD